MRMLRFRMATAVVVVAVLAAIGFVLLARDHGDRGSSSMPGENRVAGPGAVAGKDAPAAAPVRLIGDGSTSDTGPQPNQPAIDKLKPGEKPPQFVVFSWDGAGEQVGINLFERFRRVAAENNAKMTFFLSGIYVLPEARKAAYQPPLHSVGASDIGYLKDENVRLTIEQVRKAWLDGHEIGTHFNGHFCGAKGGDKWSVANWRSEIEQSYAFVENWRTNTGYTDLAPFPFDYRKELVGGRAPCLEGGPLVRAAKEFGWRYDSSGKGGNQVWPKKKDGLWDMPLQSLPFPGGGTQLSMDYNIMYQQSGGKSTDDNANFPAWEKQATDMLVGGFNRVYNGNRAPLIIGNHFERWNGGIYMNAVEQTVKTVCKRDGVRCVSFRELVDWLDAQDPAVVAELQGLEMGRTPDWARF
jgi:hypothetical protein